MDSSDYSRNHLGVNKIGKTIRKNPSKPVSPVLPVSQPQVYNINKNDFRNIVQQLTGSPAHHYEEPVQPRGPPVKSPSMRLQRIRPPPLSGVSVNRPRMPVHVFPGHGVSVGVPLNNSNSNSNNNIQRYDQLGQYLQRVVGSNTAESPISAYMRYLQHSINDPNQQTQSGGLLPNPHGPPLLSSPRTRGPAPVLPSPNSQFLLPSLSGWSPYPLLSPGYQFSPPLTTNLSYSPGILGPGLQVPRSPGVGFSLSPRFFTGLSPRWRD